MKWEHTDAGRAWGHAYRKRPDVAAKRRAWFKTESGRRSRRATAAKQRAKHSVEVAARTVVKNAVRRGELIPGPCEVCGVTGAEAHHDDYGKPLDVRWLCPVHHREHHAQRI